MALRIEPLPFSVAPPYRKPVNPVQSSQLMVGVEQEAPFNLPLPRVPGSTHFIHKHIGVERDTIHQSVIAHHDRAVQVVGV